MAVRSTSLAKKVRYYKKLCDKTYDVLQTGDEDFITAYKDAVKNPIPDVNFQTFAFKDRLYASDELLLNATIDKTIEEFEDWYFQEYVINRYNYKK